MSDVAIEKIEKVIICDLTVSGSQEKENKKTVSGNEVMTGIVKRDLW